MQINSVTSQTSTHSDYSGTIGVVAFQFDGRGDIAGADKIASLAAEILPNAKVEFAIFDPDLPTFMLPPQLPREEVVQTVKRQVLEEKEFMSKISSLSCLILYPTYQDSAIPPEITQACKAHAIPMIKIRESGAGPGEARHIQGKTYPLGVEKGEYGIMLPEAHYRHYLSSQNEPPKKRLYHLANISPKMQQEILGGPFSEATIAQFDAEAKLFSGYCRSAHHALDFATTVVQLEETGAKVVVCILNDNLKFNDFIDVNQDLFKDLKVAAYRSGFGTINITEGDRQRSLSFPPGPKTGNRTLHVILRTLPGSQVESLYKASEKESLATGEQSVWEHLALGKKVAIEFSHVRLPETQSYVKLLKRLSPKLGDLFEKSIIGEASFDYIARCMENDIPDMINWQLAKHKLIFFKQLRENPQLQKDWDAFIRHLNEKHQFKPHLAKILMEEISHTHSPPIEAQKGIPKT